MKHYRGSYTCVCGPGYHGDGRTCLKIDYCIANQCGAHGHCISLETDHYCECHEGYIDQSGGTDPSSGDLLPGKGNGSKVISSEISSGRLPETVRETLTKDHVMIKMNVQEVNINVTIR